ncbi:MAG: hypothetical protein ACKV2Q_13985, partial [Planctomycetaceae bacterium]
QKWLAIAVWTTRRSPKRAIFDRTPTIFRQTFSSRMNFRTGTSDAITATLHLAKPAFAFFGHYHGKDRFGECDFGSTQVFHLHGLEFRGRSDTAEAQSVGMLRWSETSATFDYVDAQWLATFTRHNWKYR